MLFPRGLPLAFVAPRSRLRMASSAIIAIKPLPAGTINGRSCLDSRTWAAVTKKPDLPEGEENTRANRLWLPSGIRAVDSGGYLQRLSSQPMGALR